jgi:hypothetical protein
MSTPSLTVVVLGILGRTPVAGVAWQVLHYLEGFRRLGVDVWYVEDTGEWPYDAERNTVTDDPSYTIRYIAGMMARCGLDDRWSYRCAAGGAYFGLSDTQVSTLFGRADVLVNLTGSTELRDDHLRVPVRVYLETDPVLPQIEVASGSSRTIALLDTHTHLFTYGENFGAPDCGVPIHRFTYHPTRQPVVLDWWQPANGGEHSSFTTVANWRQRGKDIEWNGERYLWSKDAEFLKVLELPSRTTQPFELALASNDQESLDLLASYGWSVVDATPLSADLLSYRDYLCRSLGEFTVAKDQNVRLRSGWFSDRSACYLAAGRPVITQDTGFGNILPVGRGLFAFKTLDDAVAACDEIAADYRLHCSAAREIASEHFSSDRVLGDLLDRIGG